MVGPVLAWLLLSGCAPCRLGDTFCEHPPQQLFDGTVSSVRIELAAFGEESLPHADHYEGELGMLRQGLEQLWPAGVEIHLPERDEIPVARWARDDGRFVNLEMMLDMERDHREHRSSAHEATFWFLLTERKIASNFGFSDAHPGGTAVPETHVGALHLLPPSQTPGSDQVPRLVMESVILHEVGHMVGLMTEIPVQQAHVETSAGRHCTEEHCVMQRTYDPYGHGWWMFGWLDGTINPGDLAPGPRCLEDIAALRAAAERGTPW